jgi:hypothetical protein
MFIKNVTDKLLQKLNSNTQDITFRGGSLLQVTNDKFEFRTFTNYYTVETTEFIPVMFDYISSPKNIPNKEVYDYTVDITFGLTGENETELQNQRLAIDAFRASLINNPLDTLVTENVTRNIVTSATDLSMVRDVVIVNAKKRVLVSMQVFIQSGIGIVFGNNRVVELRVKKTGTPDPYVVLQPFDFNIVMQKFLDGEMEFSDNNIKNIARNRSMTFSLRMFHEDTALMQDIIKDLNGVANLGIVYQLRFKLPNNNQSFVTYDVILTDGSIGSAFGTQNTFDLNFRLAYE